MAKGALALLMPSLSKGKGGAAAKSPKRADLKSESAQAVIDAVEAKDADALKSAMTSFYEACSMGEEADGGDDGEDY